MTSVANGPHWLDEAADAVRAGGVVALPYERLFGLAALALDGDAVRRSAAIKGRLPARPISVIVASAEDVALVAASFPKLARELAERHWPGPLTLLVPAKDGLPEALIGKGRLVGVRVPGPSPALELVRRVGAPLTATSANRTGGPDALTHDDVLGLEGVDLVIAGSVPGPPGSTIVDASGERPVIVRRGVLEIER
jgi:L-threonylcarbamoyladenylate synthase